MDSKTLTFHYIKAPDFRTVHVDGVIGGLSPNGYLHAAVYSERVAIPQSIAVELRQDGTLGDEVLSERLGRSGLVRELSVDLVLSFPAATALHQWLGEHIKRAQQAVPADAEPAAGREAPPAEGQAK